MFSKNGPDAVLTQHKFRTVANPLWQLPLLEAKNRESFVTYSSKGVRQKESGKIATKKVTEA